MVFSQIPHMTYQQYRTARRLVHECCNYDCGNCLLLDNSEECVCPQSITYSLICKWFRAAVLPLDAGVVNANWKMSFFAGMGCHFLAVSMRWVCSLDYPLLVGLKPVKS